MRLSILVPAVALAGCASGYQRNYKPAGDHEAVARTRVAPPTGRSIV